MDEVKIVAIVSFTTNYNSPGSQGFEEPYDETKSIESYKQYFESETKRMNNAKHVKLVEIKITEHDQNGNYLLEMKVAERSTKESIKIARV